jgi:hypothetical protein
VYKVSAGNDLARHSPLLSQLMHGILHVDVQGWSQFIREVRRSTW